MKVPGKSEWTVDRWDTHGHAKVKTRLPQSSRKRQDDTGPKQHTEKLQDFAGDYGDLW